MRGHTDEVTSTALSANGKVAVTGSRDNTARVWDVDTGETVRVLEGHTSSVTSVAQSSDGMVLVTGSYDGTSRVWDVATGETARVLEGHTAGVSSVALSSDGRLAMTQAWNEIITWDLDTGARLAEAPPGAVFPVGAPPPREGRHVLGSNAGITLDVEGRGFGERGGRIMWAQYMRLCVWERRVPQR